MSWARLRSRRFWGFVLVGLILAGIGFLCQTRLLFTGGGYLRNLEFPPLIYVPNYEQGPFVRGGAAILVEAVSGTILFAKNEHQRRAPASTTKMMTALVVLEKADPWEIVSVSRKAAGTPGSSLGLRKGDKLHLGELLRGVLVCSGNDGSVALAEHVAGSEQAFAEMMNRRARELGALHTNFQNAHGLRAPSHYTTAFDLALIARYAMNQPLFAKFVSTREGKMRIENEKKVRQIRNTNRLLWSFAGADGIKTGTTNEAGYCLVASATREGRRFIAVVLHSPDRWGDCARMLEYGFSCFSLKRLARAGKPCIKVNVPNGTPSKLSLYPRRDLMVVMRKGEEGKYQRFMETDVAALTPPIRPGTVVGRIGYAYEGRQIEGVDLITKRFIKRKGCWWLHWRRKR
jgi:D-alanyl-D-alanine carboxypeptidase (penicillin-binding protein 5/6)